MTNDLPEPDKRKVVVLDERDCPDEMKAPPNFFAWFECREFWDRLSEE